MTDAKAHLRTKLTSSNSSLIRHHYYHSSIPRRAAPTISPLFCTTCSIYAHIPRTHSAPANRAEDRTCYYPGYHMGTQQWSSHINSSGHISSWGTFPRQTGRQGQIPPICGNAELLADNISLLPQLQAIHGCTPLHTLGPA